MYGQTKRIIPIYILSIQINNVLRNYVLLVTTIIRTDTLTQHKVSKHIIMCINLKLIIRMDKTYENCY